MPSDDIISTADAAKVLGKSVATVNRLAADGTLVPVAQASGVTGARFYKRSDVDALLDPVPSDGAA